MQIKSLGDREGLVSLESYPSCAPLCCQLSDTQATDLSPRLPFCSVHSCSFSVVFLPLMISGRKPPAGTDLACYHLVAQSLKDDFAALSTYTARHWQGVSKRGLLGNKLGSWCGTTAQRDGHTCILMSRLL